MMRHTSPFALLAFCGLATVTPSTFGQMQLQSLVREGDTIGTPPLTWGSNFDLDIDSYGNVLIQDGEWITGVSKPGSSLELWWYHDLAASAGLVQPCIVFCSGTKTAKWSGLKQDALIRKNHTSSSPILAGSQGIMAECTGFDPETRLSTVKLTAALDYGNNPIYLSDDCYSGVGSSPDAGAEVHAHNQGKVLMYIKKDNDVEETYQGIAINDRSSIILDTSCNTPSACDIPGWDETSTHPSTWDGIDTTRFSMNTCGDVVFRAVMTGGTEVLWMLRPVSGCSSTYGAPQQIAKIGDYGGDLTSFGTRPIAINEGGDLAFICEPGMQDENAGIFKYTASTQSLQRLAVQGQEATGVDGFVFHVFREPISMNNQGKIAFRATIRHEGSGEWRDSVWVLNGSALSLVVQQGGAAFGGYRHCGIVDGATFTSFSAPVLDNAGNVVFFSTVDSDTPSVWAKYGNPGVLRLVSAYQDFFPGGGIVSPQDYDRSDMASGNGTDGLRAVLNDLAQMCFQVTVETGSGMLTHAMRAINIDEAPADDCPADFNLDGFVTGDDLDQFIEQFEAGAPCADFNGNGFIEGTDFDEFEAAFNVGC